MNEYQTEFVVLFHTTGPNSTREADHWDLMIRNNECLWTWACLTEPGNSSIAELQQLKDHRIEYLEYEGEISGGRGSVSCWDHGKCSVDGSPNGQMIVNFEGKRLSGKYRLIPCQDQRWRLQLSE